MDIVELKRLYGDRLTLIGNIDVDLLARGTPEQVEAQVKLRISQLAKGGGFLLASSNSVCDYVKPENYTAMLTAGRRHGVHGAA
jgi:uroporphyrinogen decarboxylase